MVMLVQPLRARTLKPYEQWINSDLLARLNHHGRELQHKKIYEINSTAVGGGVVELLQAKLPLMRGLGIDAHWLVIPPDDVFFGITKQLHNCLQGTCSNEHPDLSYYQSYSKKIAQDLPLDGDLYILHDPQTLGLIPALVAAGKEIVWRCHIDLTTSSPHIHDWIIQQLKPVNTIIVSMESYAHGLPHDKIRIVAPAIDPLAAKNHPVSASTLHTILQAQHIDTERPFIAQVSRFDRFKDPIGVIDVYDELYKQLPAMQCVLLGNYASDDPEGEAVYKEVRARASSSPGDVLVLNVSSDLLVNAIQSQAAAIIQYSSREGFGLTVTEPLWKETLVMARPVGGISLQVIDDKTGLTATGNHAQDARKLAAALQSPTEVSRLTRHAHEHVRRHFITPVMLDHYLTAYQGHHALV